MTMMRSGPLQFLGSVGEGLDAAPGAVHVAQPERDRLDRVGSFRDRLEGGQGGLAVIRVKELGERSAAHLVRRPSEKSGQGRARGSDPPLGVEREDEIGGVLQEQAEPVLALLERRLQGLES